MISCCAERAPLIAMVSPACAPASASSSEPHLRPPTVTDMPASRARSSQNGRGSPRPVLQNVGVSQQDFAPKALFFLPFLPPEVPCSSFRFARIQSHRDPLAVLLAKGSAPGGQQWRHSSQWILCRRSCRRCRRCSRRDS